MKLYFSVASPYSRLVRIIIQQFNIAVDELEINPFDNDRDFLQVNPLAKVPCLVLPNQQALFDSEVIARYLDQEFAHSRLFAGEPYWSQQQFFALLKGCLDIAVQLRQEQMRAELGAESLFFKQRFEQAILRSMPVIEAKLSMLESLMPANNMLLVCLLEYLDFRHQHLDWRQLAPNCCKWLHQHNGDSCYIETQPSSH